MRLQTIHADQKYCNVADMALVTCIVVFILYC